MLHSSYEIKDIQLILELKDSARQTLLIILDQFGGLLSGRFDRSKMDAAQKQKMKRGIAELKDKGLLIPSNDRQSHFSLNPQIIEAKNVLSREEHYLSSGLYKESCAELLTIVIAIEHFFDDFFNKSFVIMYKSQAKKPRIPVAVFKVMYDYTEECYAEEKNYKHYGTILNRMINLAEYIKYYSDSRQQYLQLSKAHTNRLHDEFKEFVSARFTITPRRYSSEGKALCKFIRNWFMDNYPEFTI